MAEVCPIVSVRIFWLVIWINVTFDGPCDRSRCKKKISNGFRTSRIP